MAKIKIVAMVCAAVFSVTAIAAEEAKDPKPVAVRKLGKDDAAAFVRLTVARSARFDELTIFRRVLREKQAEFQEALSGLEKKFGLDPKKSYSYEGTTHKLFELTAAAKKGAEPTKKEVKSFKDAKSAEPLATAMVARKLVENQITVLAQLSREKEQEAALVDAKIHKMFKLDDNGTYSFNTADSTIYRTGTKAKAGVKKSAK